MGCVQMKRKRGALRFSLSIKEEGEGGGCMWRLGGGGKEEMSPQEHMMRGVGYMRVCGWNDGVLRGGEAGGCGGEAATCAHAGCL